MKLRLVRNSVFTERDSSTRMDTDFSQLIFLSLVLFQAFRNSECSATFSTTLYKASAGKRLMSVIDTSVAESKLDCCRRCSLRTGCLSINFNQMSEICEFVSLPSLALHSYAVSQGTWNAYTTDGMFR